MARASQSFPTFEPFQPGGDKSPQGRLMLSFLVFIMILFALSHFFKPPVPPPEQPKDEEARTQEDQEPEAQQESASDSQDTAQDEGTGVEPDFQPTEGQQEKTFELSNDALRLVFTNRGGALLSGSLLKFDRSVKGKKQPEVRLLAPLHGTWRTFCLQEPGEPETPKEEDSDSEPSRPGLEELLWEAEALEDEASGVKELRFTLCTAEGLEIRKRFRLEPGEKYVMKFDLVFRNHGTKPVRRDFELAGPVGILPEVEGGHYMEGYLGLYKGEGQWELDDFADLGDTDKGEEEKAGEGLEEARWCALTNKYFVAALFTEGNETIAPLVFRGLPAPKKENEALLKELGFSPYPNLAVFLQTTVELGKTGEPDDRLAQAFELYLGPKSEEYLEQVEGRGFEGFIEFGGIAFLANPLLGILGFLYGLVRNYGVAIILLTIIVKLALFLPTRKQQISMWRMQKLAPRMKALREKYKKDRQKMNVEIMKLYKEHGVNPLGGCLPILVQLPIFIALWRGLDLSFALRQAPFTLWIQDLSQPDRLARIPFDIPILGWEFLNLLPVLMTVFWMASSFMQPLSPDPQQRQQQKIMRFMPLIFAFICYSLPSGVILYWLTSSFYSIFEQKLIKSVWLK